jgi:hypothetical protein
MPSYSPELIQTMRAALDEAMTKIPAEQATPGIKAHLAELILKAAADGRPATRVCWPRRQSKFRRFSRCWPERPLRGRYCAPEKSMLEADRPIRFSRPVFAPWAPTDSLRCFAGGARRMACQP